MIKYYRVIRLSICCANNGNFLEIVLLENRCQLMIFQKCYEYPGIVTGFLQIISRNSIKTEVLSSVDSLICFRKL